MDPKPILQLVRTQLAESHDLRNTQIRLFQISKDSTLALTPMQRGTLNFYSALPHLEEGIVLTMLDDMQTPTSTFGTDSSSAVLPSTWNGGLQTSSSSSSLFSFEPFIKKNTQGKYQWNLYDQGRPIPIDPTWYDKLEDAQTQASQFIDALHHNDETNWLRLSIVNWTQQSHAPRIAPCQAELLHVRQHYYLLVTQTLTEVMTKDLQDQKTVHYTTKAMNMEPLVDPTWITRGFIPQLSHGLFYIVFRINPQTQDTLHTLAHQLKRIVFVEFQH